MTAQEKRKAVASKYSTIIGRNTYSQPFRDYCFRKYNGQYYSDCSSSISYTYKEAGFGFGILNTAGMYYSINKEFVKLDIENGQVKDVSKLRVGDCLMFKGSDPSRPLQIGHVEMVYNVTKTQATLCGHGSGVPSYKDMHEYCSQRHNGNRGLVCVLRFIKDDSTKSLYKKPTAGRQRNCQKILKNKFSQSIAVDGDFGNKSKIALIRAWQKTMNSFYSLNPALDVDGDFGPKSKAEGAKVFLKNGADNLMVLLMQIGLMVKGYYRGGLDGDFGPLTLGALTSYQEDNDLEVDGVCGKNTWTKLFI